MTQEAILVTGTAGFIGLHLSQRLLAKGHQVIGLDNLNDYDDIALKKARLALLQKQKGFTFHKLDIIDQTALSNVFENHAISQVVHLAAQAGVRYSIHNPQAYINANLVGFANVLEACRHSGVAHLVFASSSSVYGGNTKLPFSVHDNVDHPVSLYAATKKANELMAHCYAHLYQIPCTGLRFFTVYGPWGRSDMAMSIFTQAILAGEPIDVFNHGKMQRDFTYIDDIIEGIVRTLDNPPSPNPDWDTSQPDPGTSFAPYRLYNIGNNQPVELAYLIETLEKTIGKKAQKRFLPMQPGDVIATYANVDDLAENTGFRAATPIEEGIAAFVTWYRDYYRA